MAAAAGSGRSSPPATPRTPANPPGRAQQDRAQQQGSRQGAGSPDREMPRRPIGKYENVGAAAKPRGAFGDGLDPRDRPLEVRQGLGRLSFGAGSREKGDPGRPV